MEFLQRPNRRPLPAAVDVHHEQPSDQSARSAAPLGYGAADEGGPHRRLHTRRAHAGAGRARRRDDRQLARRDARHAALRWAPRTAIADRASIGALVWRHHPLAREGGIRPAPVRLRVVRPGGNEVGRSVGADRRRRRAPVTPYDDARSRSRPATTSRSNAATATAACSSRRRAARRDVWTPPHRLTTRRCRRRIRMPPASETMLNADIEPDRDGDGFGDETQDNCAGDVQPGPGATPTATASATHAIPTPTATATASRTRPTSAPPSPDQRTAARPRRRPRLPRASTLPRSFASPPRSSAPRSGRRS